jgi:hypothetical protein
MWRMPQVMGLTVPGASALNEGSAVQSPQRVQPQRSRGVRGFGDDYYYYYYVSNHEGDSVQVCVRTGGLGGLLSPVNCQNVATTDESGIQNHDAESHVLFRNIRIKNLSE